MALLLLPLTPGGSAGGGRRRLLAHAVAYVADPFASEINVFRNFGVLFNSEPSWQEPGIKAAAARSTRGSVHTTA